MIQIYKKSHCCPMKDRSITALSGDIFFSCIPVQYIIYRYSLSIPDYVTGMNESIT